MKNITIIGREAFALNALKRLQTKGHRINKVITDDQGVLWQHTRLAGIVAQLKNSHSKVTRVDIPAGTDIILSLYNYMYITPCAIACVDKAIGYHPSLLPAYKGRRAIQDALSAGEKQTGGTYFHLDRGYDTGEVICQKPCKIFEGDSPKDVWGRLEIIGLELLETVIEDW